MFWHVVGFYLVLVAISAAILGFVRYVYEPAMLWLLLRQKPKPLSRAEESCLWRGEVAEGTATRAWVQARRTGGVAPPVQNETLIAYALETCVDRQRYVNQVGGYLSHEPTIMTAVFLGCVWAIIIFLSALPPVFWLIGKG